MGDKDFRIDAGTASFALAACMLFAHVLLLVLVLIPEKRLPERLAAVGPTIGLASCSAIIAIPLSIILGLVGVSRGGGQRRWGLMGLVLTALSLLVGYLAQAANWHQ